MLAFAAAEPRILVTHNARDVADPPRVAESGRIHDGCVLIWTLDHAAFAANVAGVGRPLSAHPGNEGWIDRGFAI